MVKKFMAAGAIAAAVGIAGIYGLSEWNHPKEKKEVHAVHTNFKRASAPAASTPKETIFPLDLSDQDAIQERMLNSYNYFDSAKGSFRYYSETVPFDLIIDYKLQMKNKVSYSTSLLNQATGLKTEETFDGNNLISLNHNDKTYQTQPYNVQSKGQYMKLKNAVTKNGDGTKNYNYPATGIELGYAGTSLHSKEIALGFLEDHSLWKASRRENILGRTAIVIDGTFDDSFQRKLSAKTFTLWMDQNSGILLKMELYNANGRSIEGIETKDIKINEAFDVESPKIPKDFKQFRP
ncbi:sigma-E factor regulatory protein RseB domain-containing protein [Falsibacillus pallidus]|uniref:sigma-E factor regulatory protein RseB domain-containing protein n=1 Tax=Falsibacillus pallidus TaxID=493781 RepID=UPI003D966542